MSRSKGSKNKKSKVTKAKTVKKTKIAKAAKKVKYQKVAKTLKASAFEEQIKSVLLNILDLFKASLIDAFRQYIESKMLAGAPASITEFSGRLKNTIAIHGISDETLLSSLDEVELEYLSNGPAVKPAPQPKVIARGRPKKEVNEVPTPTQQPAPDKQPEVAAPNQGLKEDPNDFFSESLIVGGKESVNTDEKSNNKSVFDSLDII